LTAVPAILAKELRVEMRSKQTINAYLLLSLLILASFRFSLALFDPDYQTLAAPILWTTIFFSGMFSIAPSYRREAEQGTRDGLLLAPVPASDVYLGKMLSSLVVLSALEAFTVAVFLAFFPVDVPEPGALVALLALGTVGFVAVGSLIAAISANLRQSEVMLPVLLVPVLLFTVVMSAVSGTAQVLTGASLDGVAEEARLLAAFAVVFVAAGYLLIEYVMEG